MSNVNLSNADMTGEAYRMPISLVQLTEADLGYANRLAPT